MNLVLEMYVFPSMDVVVIVKGSSIWKCDTLHFPMLLTVRKRPQREPQRVVGSGCDWCRCQHCAMNPSWSMASSPAAICTSPHPGPPQLRDAKHPWRWLLLMTTTHHAWKHGDEIVCEIHTCLQYQRRSSSTPRITWPRSLQGGRFYWTRKRWESRHESLWQLETSTVGVWLMRTKVSGSIAWNKIRLLDLKHLLKLFYLTLFCSGHKRFTVFKEWWKLILHLMWSCEANKLKIGYQRRLSQRNIWNICFTVCNTTRLFVTRYSDSTLATVLLKQLRHELGISSVDMAKDTFFMNITFDTT